MAYRDHEARACEDVGLAELHFAAGQLGRVQDHEEGVAILLDLGALVGGVGVFHGQLVQAEFFLDLVHQLDVGLQEAQPDEGTLLFQHVADLVEADLAQLPALLVDRAIDDHLGIDHVSFLSSCLLFWPDQPGSRRQRSRCRNTCAMMTPPSVMTPPTA
ncbi:conserved hypothetical protein [Ricinus communis]|uniref:Uncharacterized protein n=1 Tax=Ricinus communis TaxID=3988 RepID=B9TPC6_RICCO|nr:conserved hypothetical protein [Ricinus communis]